MATQPPREAPPRVQTRTTHRQAFLENGLGALALGGVFLLLSLLFHRHPPLITAARALQVPAWFLLCVAGLLLGLHYVLKDKSEDDSAEADALAVLPRRQPAPAPVARPTRAVPTTWSASVFSVIEWRRFEAVCEALFSRAGLTTRAQSHGPEGGVDLSLYASPLEGPVCLVRCRQWQTRRVDVYELREFLGAVNAQGLQHGTYATTSTFAPDAPAFARTHGIRLLDGAALLQLIGQRTPVEQRALLAVAFEGDYARPTCPTCAIKMVERVRAKDSVSFWACVNRPRCEESLPMGRRGA